MARQALLDAVLERVVINGHGPKNWFKRLPPDAQKELSEFRDFFHRGGHGIPKKAFAVSVIAVAKDRGWKISGVQGVVAWLNDQA